MKIVLGIDPGLCITGYALVTQQGRTVNLVDAAMLKLPERKSISVRIGIFYDAIARILDERGVSDIALETPFLGKNAQSFLKLGYLRGVVYLLAHQRTLVVHEFSPSQVKAAVTGYGGASKEQVCRMVRVLFAGMSMPEKYDITDAVAVALCGLWHERRFDVQGQLR